MSHSHDQNTNINNQAIKFGLVLNSLFTVFEFIVGISTGSLALIADASHNLTDTFMLTVSFIANKLSLRRADNAKSYGYGRATILAALLNASIMLAVAGFIVFEAIGRLRNPQSVEGGIVALVATIGIAVNGSIAYVLSKNRKDLNMRSAYVDMAFDALSSLGAVVAGLLILLTGIEWIDSVVGLIIAGLLVYNTIKILNEAIHILLEGTPEGLDTVTITEVIMSVDDVRSVDDMHVWAIRSGYNTLSCHIVIDEKQLQHSRKIVESVKTMLHKKFEIDHATIEVELEDYTRHKGHEKH